MPIFDGAGIYGWVARVERFFRIGGYNDEEKLALVSVSLSGEALSWYNWVVNTRQFGSWVQFKSSLMLRFGNLKIRGPSQSLFCIKQKGSLADYIQRFEDLSSQVSGLDEQKLEGIFLNGLTQEMQELVHMQKPRNLDEMVAEARAIESSIMRRVVKKELMLANKENLGSDHKGNSVYNTNTWKMKTVTTDPVINNEKQVGRVEQRPRRHNTNAELDEKRKKGICFKCDDPWSRDYKCPNKELRVLTTLNGYEVEVLDENYEEIYTETIGECMTLSFSSFRGMSGPSTTKLRGSVGKDAVVIMLDSGASHNFISPTTVKKLKLKCREDPNLNVKLGTGILVNGLGVCEKVTFSAQNLEFTTDFIVLELGHIDVILGVYWLRTLGDCRVNWERNEMSFIHNGKMVSLSGESELMINKMSLKSLSSDYEIKSKGVAMELCNQQANPSMVEMIDDSIQAVLKEYDCVFEIPTTLPPNRGREHAISLVKGTTTVSVRPYRYPHAQKEVMERMVKEMLDSGIIRPSQSPFSSPILLVKKKNNSWRFCVDYRALNRATVPDKFPIPMIDQLLDELNGSVIFSKLDLRAGYHQIRMKEEDIPKTAFRTHDGHYEFLVMPFGLTNAPATFQALMNELFRPYLRKFILVFFDDILVCSESLQQHVEHLTVVLSILKENQLFANKKKCMFGQQQVDYLGHIISKEGVSTDPAKTQAMTKWVTPKSVKELRGFLGLTGYYRRFIKGYGMLAKPLTELLKKDNFEWSSEAQATFDKLKQAMSTAPVLSLPNFDEVFTVEADASGYGLGAVLMQNRRPIAYFSHGLTSQEQLKPVYERELMAIVLAIQKWKHYLFGRHFVVHTDQKRVENTTTDGLSRMTQTEGTLSSILLWAITVPTALQLQDIFDDIEKDEQLQRDIKTYTTEPDKYCKFNVKDGRLWFKHRLVVKLHGYPASIVSDRGSTFLSSFWKDCFRISGTKLKYNTAFHPQTNGQTEVLNREPPAIVRFEEQSTKVMEVEALLKERDLMLTHIKDQLLRAQQLMKNNADKHRRDVELEVGDWVFLKLRPYRQHSVTKRACQKLAIKYFGPYEVMERIGKAAYRLKLPEGSKIHPVFHISQIKKVLGEHQKVIPLPDVLNETEEVTMEPEEVLDTRYNDKGVLEVLVRLKGLPDNKKTWEVARELQKQFPSLALEDKLRFEEGGIDKPHQVYTRRKNKEEVARVERERTTCD
ncbi:PREDICTED: uncharacterized protein LOC104699246 [Camelina sativa]|uniref:Uncharacterized protein LOC104699246 n=1 Tax=Camelina sativa TaxID=90675 RepID=A0ABM0SLA2_CAMSA|nr:PREDICTED: uncharacterized protein LOC104699246 [Camelina sativa]